MGMCLTAVGAAPAKRPKVVPKLPPAQVVPALPAGPTNVAVVQASENQVDLRWDSVPGALGYEVLVKRGGGWLLNEEDPNLVPITTSTSLTGLAPGTEIELAIRAVLPTGVSELSAPLTVRTPAAASPAVSPPAAAEPLPVVDKERAAPARVKEADDPALSGIDLNAPITDLVPPPPKPAAAPVKPGTASATPAGPPPPVPEGLMGLFVNNDTIRLSWRPVREASGYLVEEERDGEWVTAEEGVIQENRASLTLKKHPTPGPYYFRVRAIRYGARSNPSLPSKVER